MQSLFAAAGLDDIMALGTGFFMMVIVPLVWILLHHQRKMAEFLHRGALQQDQQAQLNRLEAEVGALKDKINHLILAVDDKRELQERVAPPMVPHDLRSGP